MTVCPIQLHMVMFFRGSEPGQVLGLAYASLVATPTRSPSSAL